MKILITGATDGIGLETARKLTSLGHQVLIHGRNENKLHEVGKELESETYQADFSALDQVKNLAKEVSAKHTHIDVLINNAGIFKTQNPITKDGQDVRFVVNTISPYLLTKKLLPIMSSMSRVINLSSAAQSAVDIDALTGKKGLNDYEAYAQSKLAITMWTKFLSQQLISGGPVIIAVNPGSFLGTKMVQEGFGTTGNDINIGVDILIDFTLNKKYSGDSGRYFDNDSGQFSEPQADGLNEEKTRIIIEELEKIIK